jgi:hypothetical protein
MKTFYHVNVAKAAFAPYFKPRALDWIIRGNFNTDFYGSVGWMMKLKNALNFISNHWYKAIDHMDDMFEFGLIVEAWNELRRRVAECADDDKYPPKRVKNMFITLGRASHSMTDVYSHSNYMELLYDYYRTDASAAKQVEQSGLSMPEYVGRHAPTFTQIADSRNGEYAALIDKWLRPQMFTDQSVPDEGSRSHSEMNKDNPEAKRLANANFPDMFNQMMALADRDVTAIFKKFFEELKETRFLKYTILTNAMPGALDGPGKFERRARFWSSKFDAWD